MSDGVREILNATCFRKIDVEALLDPDHPMWIAFDPEIGYVPADVVMKDGMDYSRSTYTHEPTGERRMVNYRDVPCRVNTYGDSFTQCQQVSDDETWQERLAAHLGEPIRNLGSGGYSVNSAVLRAMRMEETDRGAEYVILNIFDDDHIRNLDAARWIRTNWHEEERTPGFAYPLHGLPWSHLRWDLDQGKWLELPGKCKNAEDLLALTDPGTFYEAFKDDIIVRLFALQQGFDVDVSEFEALAEALNIDVSFRDGDMLAAAEKFHRQYGFQSTQYLLERKFRPYIESRGKKLMILLSYSLGSMGTYVTGGPRFDPEFLDWLKQSGYFVVDSLEKHAEDFKAFNLDINGYIGRYYIQAAGAAVFGHYDPTGNHWFGFSIKNELVDWLDPKPPAYAE